MLVLSAIVVALLVWAARRESPTYQQVQQHLARLRAAGEPLTAADLARRYPDPAPEHDAAKLLANAFAIVTNNSVPADVPLITGSDSTTEPISPMVLTQLVAFCKSTAGLSNAIALTLPAQARFGSDWHRAFTNTIGLNFVAARHMSHSIVAQAITAAELGDGEAATQWIERGHRFSRTIPCAGSLVQHMMRRAIDRLMCDAVERVLNRTTLTDAQLERILRGVGEEDPEAIRDCFRVERAWVAWLFEEARENKDVSLAFGMKRQPWWERVVDRLRNGPFYAEEDHLRCLQLSPAEIDSFADPIAAQQRINAQSAELQRTLKGTLGRFVLPNFTKAITTQFNIRAKVAAMKAALEVERYRLAHGGALPSMPMPSDIAPGKQLHLQPLKRGFMVYSVGADGVDNGGITQTNRSAPGTYDVTFRIER